MFMIYSPNMPLNSLGYFFWGTLYSFVRLGPMPPSERRTQTGTQGQDTVRAGTFSRKNMNNQPGTMKIHENRPGTMKNHKNRPGTMKSRPGTMKNQPGTMNNHENPPVTMKNQPGTKQTMKTHLEP